jgi:hypothetical protein
MNTTLMRSPNSYALHGSLSQGFSCCLTHQCNQGNDTFVPPACPLGSLNPLQPKPQ